VAARVGAVNTFWCADDGALVGDNTDVGGFVRAARTILTREPLDLEVALVGAGGAAAAVLAAVERWPGCVVRLWSRRPERARRSPHDSPHSCACSRRSPAACATRRSW
jgi:shikimate dehydrogenase